MVRCRSAQPRPGSATSSRSVDVRFATPHPGRSVSAITCRSAGPYAPEPRARHPWARRSRPAGCSHPRAAVDEQVRAGDPLRLVGDQPQHRACHVLRLADPGQRQAPSDPLLGPLPHESRHLGSYQPRRDSVHPHAGRQLTGELAGQVEQSRLARAVRTDVRPHAVGALGTDVDDCPAVLAHPCPPGELDQAQRRLHVHREGVAPDLGLGFHQRAERGIGPGVVDEDVESAELPHGEIRARRQVRGIRDRAGAADRPDAGGGEPVHGHVHSRGITSGDADHRSRLAQGPRRGEADAPGGAGDQSRPSVECR